MTVILVCSFVSVDGCRSVSKIDAPSGNPAEATAGWVGTTALALSVLLMEERANGQFDAGETISITTEVTNHADRVATGIVVHVTGTPGFVRDFPASVMIGELQPSETKRVLMQGVVSPPDSAHEAELTLSVTADNAEARERKQFLAAWRP